MSEHLSGHRRAAVILAVLRATLVAVIFVSERLVDARQLADSGFFVILGVAAAYSLLGIAVALRPSSRPPAQFLGRLWPAFDVSLLVGLAYTSGAAYSDVRKAFFVIPLAAAFSERPSSTARWSVLAVTTFTLQAVAGGGHPHGVINTWQRLTLNQDLYLAWTGAAATLLAFALRRRTARVEELAASRQRLVTQAIESVERERTRLANALHDSPVQNLIAARHDLRRAERSGDPESFARLHEALELTISELRKEIFDLHPHVLDHVGLKAALEQVARRHTGDAEVTIRVEIEAGASFPYQDMLFALGRELLGNAAKHARASEIRLTVSQTGGGVTLEVSDNGRGIAESRVRQAPLDGHIGLAAVTERVSALNGTVKVTTAPGRGTSVLVALPPEIPDGASTTALAGAERHSEVSDRVTPHDTLWVSPAQA